MLHESLNIRKDKLILIGLIPDPVLAGFLLLLCKNKIVIIILPKQMHVAANTLLYFGSLLDNVGLS